MVSALGPRTAVVVTDQNGRFHFPTLSPGPYLLRVHVRGFVSSRGQVVEVRASVQANSSISVRHAGSLAAPEAGLSVDPAIPILAAGIGIAIQPLDAAATSDASTPVPASESPDTPSVDDHSETAWQLRHMRRSILKDVSMADALLGDGAPGGLDAFSALEVHSTVVRWVCRQFLHRHAVDRSVQPVDDRLVRYTQAAFHV